MDGFSRAAQAVFSFLRGPRGEAIRYLAVGGCTTLIDYGVYYLMTVYFRQDVTLSNIVSVAVAILFAYIANKVVVFRSKTTRLRQFLLESARFLGARLATMALEVGAVYLFVNRLGQNEQLGKIEAIVLVIIANYVLSKFFVFRKEPKK
ncbi:MAG TPA: GtrA family protein [Papillibacter sp.]|jgi:putative flippase GtrA|nr:GtrA family protein [Papillibacter sp.]